MMKYKFFELMRLNGCPGNYTAVLYNRVGGYFKEVHFMWYTKKRNF